MIRKKFGTPMLSFSERVVILAISVPKGRVTTYSALARAAGGVGMASRSVTGILGKAWQKGEHRIPWHRIVYSDGHIWMNDEQYAERMLLYKEEGIEIDARSRVTDFEQKFFADFKKYDWKKQQKQM